MASNPITPNNTIQINSATYNIHNTIIIIFLDVVASLAPTPKSVHQSIPQSHFQIFTQLLDSQDANDIVSG